MPFTLFHLVYTPTIFTSCVEFTVQNLISIDPAMYCHNLFLTFVLSLKFTYLEICTSSPQILSCIKNTQNLKGATSLFTFFHIALPKKNFFSAMLCVHYIYIIMVWFNC